MHERFAFTAKYWGDAAVVCRAIEGRPGPIVDQEFGQFETWTQANEFAARLNEGLEIPPAEAEQIVISSMLSASDLLSAADSAECAGVAGHPGKAIRVQFMLAQLDLALTFCRIVRTKNSQHSERMLRNARRAFFDALHYLCHADLAPCDVDEITARLEKLQAAFEECPSQPEDSTLKATECEANLAGV